MGPYNKLQIESIPHKDKYEYLYVIIAKSIKPIAKKRITSQP